MEHRRVYLYLRFLVEYCITCNDIVGVGSECLHVNGHLK
jgi:hypothetical protein